jgi:lipoyl-dependent peroxiredoxin
MSVNVLYRTAARATGGRDGRSATLDGTFEVSLTTPQSALDRGRKGLRPDHRTVDRRAGRSAG